MIKSEVIKCRYCGSDLSTFAKGNSESSKSEMLTIDESKKFLFLGGIYHPWRRFFARTVDIFIIGTVLFFLLAIAVGVLESEKAEGFEKLLENQIIAWIILYIAWMPLEAIFLTSTGTTPAKWLFGIRATTEDGEKLSFSNALKRTLLVWLQGMGVGIPIVALFTQFFAYRRLIKTGTTLWDTATNAVVVHKEWSLIRAIVVVLITFVFLLIQLKFRNF